jgi:hypothetical protein
MPCHVPRLTLAFESRAHDFGHATDSVDFAGLKTNKGRYGRGRDENVGVVMVVAELDRSVYFIASRAGRPRAGVVATAPKNSFNAVGWHAQAINSLMLLSHLTQACHQPRTLVFKLSS